MRIALVHYSAPPVIGGVERVLARRRRGPRDRAEDARDFPLMLRAEFLTERVVAREQAETSHRDQQ